jgi:hypothetical protein
MEVSYFRPPWLTGSYHPRFLVYTILCRTTFRSFACQDLDEGESFHQVHLGPLESWKPFY